MSAIRRAASASNFKVYIGNLPWTVSKRELQNYLSKFGAIRDCSVLFNKKTGLSRGYGFAIFRNRDGVVSTLAQQNHHLEGHKLTVTSDRLVGMSKEALKQTEGDILA